MWYQNNRDLLPILNFPNRSLQCNVAFDQPGPYPTDTILLLSEPRRRNELSLNPFYSALVLTHILRLDVYSNSYSVQYSRFERTLRPSTFVSAGRDAALAPLDPRSSLSSVDKDALKRNGRDGQPTGHPRRLAT